MPQQSNLTQPSMNEINSCYINISIQYANDIFGVNNYRWQL